MLWMAYRGMEKHLSHTQTGQGKKLNARSGIPRYRYPSVVCHQSIMAKAGSMGIYGWMVRPATVQNPFWVT